MTPETQSPDLRHRAVALLEHWFHAREASAIRPVNPLVAVQELHLVDSTGTGMHASERRTSGSRPPIRDMDPLSRRLDPIFKHIGLVNRAWLVALEAHAEHGTLRKAAVKMARKAEDQGKVTAMLWRDFNQGLAVLQSEMVRERL